MRVGSLPVITSLVETIIFKSHKNDLPGIACCFCSEWIFDKKCIKIDHLKIPSPKFAHRKCCEELMITFNIASIHGEL